MSMGIIGPGTLIIALEEVPFYANSLCKIELLEKDKMQLEDLLCLPSFLFEKKKEVHKKQKNSEWSALPMDHFVLFSEQLTLSLFNWGSPGISSQASSEFSMSLFRGQDQFAAANIREEAVPPPLTLMQLNWAATRDYN